MSLAFWENVNKEIKRQNTTQEWVSKKSDISYMTFKGWISKDVFPRALDAVKIAKSLGVTVEYLVNGSDESRNYSDIRLLSLAKKYHDIIEWLEILDPLTLNNARTTVKALAGSLDRNELMVSDQTAGCGNGEK